MRAWEPYRTGVDLSDDALVEIAAAFPDVRAVEDSGGGLAQSLDLLQRAPETPSVLTGEDHLSTAPADGAAGGILAAAHLATGSYVEVAEALAKEELGRARAACRTVAPGIPALSAESNPMPLTRVTPGAARALDALVAALEER